MTLPSRETLKVLPYVLTINENDKFDHRNGTTRCIELNWMMEPYAEQPYEAVVREKNCRKKL